MAHFYKQEKGIINIPPGFDKFHVSWTLENVLEGFKHFHKLHGRWPIHQDLLNCDYLPTTKTLQRKFGGIVEIRKALGIDNPHFNSGKTRSDRSHILWERSFHSEEEIYLKLVALFHEPFVHNQGRIQLEEGKSGRADFIVYYQKGKFLVDVFFPDSEYIRFMNNCVQKSRTYQNINNLIFCVVSNPKITALDIEKYTSHVKNVINKNIRFLTEQNFLQVISEGDEFPPLTNPYK